MTDSDGTPDFTADGSLSRHHEISARLRERDIDGTEPIVRDDGVDGNRLCQAAFVYDAFGLALHLHDEGDSFSSTASPKYTIPEPNVAVALRWRPQSVTSGNSPAKTPGFSLEIDEETIHTEPAAPASNSDARWTHGKSWTGGDLNPGVHTFRAVIDEAVDGHGAMIAGTIVLYDDRFTREFPDGPNDDGHLPGPTLYPSVDDLLDWL